MWFFKEVGLTGTNHKYPNVLLQTDNALVSPYNEMTMSTGVTTVYTSGEYEPQATEEKVPYNGSVFFFIYNTDNYFHFIYDTLPYLLEYFRLRDSNEFRGMKLLMSEPPKYKFVQDCLELLGIQSEDIVYATSNYQYENVVLVNSFTHDGQSSDPPHPDIWELYERMVHTAFKNPIETPKKFYVSRRSWIHGDMSNIGTNYTTRRKMMVEDELVQELAKKGYQEVFCETLSMTEKIQYFANATHIVGSIGGGMCNLVFATPDCKVVSINSPEFDTINKRFLYTMDRTDLTQFRETHTDSNLYRRVKCGTTIGEIISETESTVTVDVGNGVSWSMDSAHTLQTFQKSDVTYLDMGLNSPWRFSVEDCMKLIQ